MSQCLYESLRAVGLQHHYNRLSSVGVRSVAHLTVLTLDDFPLLGIKSMEDRTRLFHLVRELRTLDAETLLQAEIQEDACYVLPSPSNSAQKRDNKTWSNRSSVCRKLDFSPETAYKQPVCENPTETDKEVVTKTSCNSFRLDNGNLNSETRKKNVKNVNYIRDLKPKQNTSGRKTNKPTVDKENVQKQKTPVYQANLSEYSYGLPQASAPPSPSKRRPGEPRIWVCVRKRPLTSAEERRKETDVVTSAGQSCVLQESRAAVDLTHYKLQHRFFFDHVFGEACSNEEVYLRTAQPLVQHMLQGGSATCFAYGQTGAGKTHTMLGCSPVGPSQSRGRGELGLYSLAVKDLFSHLSSSPALTRLTVFVSFFEIYCGQLYDLLDHRNRLFAREDGCGNVHIAGLCHKRVESVDSLLQVISRGTEHRSQGSSGVNPVSSRSHALLQIQLRGAGQSVHGRMWFVDLAGSERASDSGDPDRRSRLEGAEINQSLLALKECIRSLDQEQGHTPFRQSKLTQVLKDSFVGDSMTCMIANISPGHSSTEHTLNTLRYADRVKELKGQKGQRKGRRVKNISESPKLRTLSQNRSSGTFRSGFRDSSPSKRAKTSSTVLTDPSPVTTHHHQAFLSSTPKNRKGNEEKITKQIFEQISPVNSQPEEKYNGFCHWNLVNQPMLDKNHKGKGLIREDQEKRKHLKLYHQHLQQFDPLMSAPNTSTTSSPKANPHAVESLIFASSSGDFKDFLGHFKACVTKAQPCSETNLLLNNDESLDLKVAINKTGATFERTLEKGGTKWAWMSDNKEISGRCSNIDGVEAYDTKAYSSGEFHNLKAPAERPLSPGVENSRSLLILSDFNCSESEPLQHRSANMDLLTCSMLEEEQEPSSVSNLNIIQEYVEESVWEPEEGADDSYLDVPQAISSSMIPWAIQFHSQRLGGTTATEQSVSPENALILHKSHKKSTAPPPAQAESSSTDVLKTPSSSEAWTSGAHWHIVQAHMETLQQMQRLSHSEGTLLVQQPDMGFDEYVQQLEQIMRRKALCVRSLISHLQPYLKTTLQHSADRL
ncbi:unnamed protein product [Knipowitschia caucasica]